MAMKEEIVKSESLESNKNLGQIIKDGGGEGTTLGQRSNQLCFRV